MFGSFQFQNKKKSPGVETQINWAYKCHYVYFLPTAEMIGYVMNDPAANFDWFGYTGSALNMSFYQIDRGTYTSLSKHDVLSTYMNLQLTPKFL